LLEYLEVDELCSAADEGGLYTRAAVAFLNVTSEGYLVFLFGMAVEEAGFPR
jgi:hypothetical protein